MIKKLINQTKRAIALVVVCGMSLSMTAQSGTYGNTFVFSGAEAAIHSVNQTFSTGGGAPLDGIVGTERVTPRGYVSFVGTATWSGASHTAHVDGYVRTYMTTPFKFPIGDNGMYRPAAVSTASISQPADAAYYALSPSTIGAAKAANIQTVSPIEYWDINGAGTSTLTLSWAASSGIASLTGSDLIVLTIVGWNGLQWVEITSAIDASSIIGGASTLTSGSISSTGLVPNAYEFYTLAAKIKIVKPSDTIVIVKDTNRIVLGPAILSDTNIDFRLSGPFHGSGTASIDAKTGVVVFTPSNPSFVGRDTIYKIRCVRNGSIVVCDSVRLLIIGQPDRSKPVIDSAEFNVGKVLVDLPPINTGGKPYTTTTSSSAGSTVTVGPDGKVNYTPKPGFTGVDTVRVIRCVDGICDVITYIIVVKGSALVALPNYLSPNGDGINDVWNIDLLLDAYPMAKALIYNRWGNSVWRSTGPYGRSTSGNNVWHGQLEGSQDLVPDGVYYYLIELDDKFKSTKTGFIEVMRK